MSRRIANDSKRHDAHVKSFQWKQNRPTVKQLSGLSTQTILLNSTANDTYNCTLICWLAWSRHLLIASSPIQQVVPFTRGKPLFAHQTPSAGDRNAAFVTMCWSVHVSEWQSYQGFRSLHKNSCDVCIDSPRVAKILQNLKRCALI